MIKQLPKNQYLCYNTLDVFKEVQTEMAKKNENRVLVPLICEECKTQNYTVSKNKKNTTERLELNKYCPKCRKNTTHKEKK